MRARAGIRARPVSLILITILVGLIGGLAITAFAGARRTGSAYDRYQVTANEFESFVISCNGGFPWPKTDLAAFARLPEVSSSTVVGYSLAFAQDQGGNPLMIRPQDDGSSLYGLRDPSGASTIEPRVLSGRLPSAPDEVAVGYGDTGLRRPSDGESISLYLVPKELFAQRRLPTSKDDAIEAPVKVVGHVLMPGELSGDQAAFWVAPSFWTAHPGAASCDAGVFQLRNGFADIPTFRAGVQAMQPDAFANDQANELLFMTRTSHLHAIVLSLLAALAALAGIMVLGQTLVRRTALGSLDTPVLRALGMTRREIVWSAALPAIVVAAGGAGIAVVCSYLGSALFPIGPARVAEPTPGMQFDGFAVALGVGIIVVTTLLSVAIPAGRLASARGGVDGSVEYRGAERRSPLASAIARLPLPPSAGAGARLALEPGHGRSATPVRTTLIGLVIAIAAMVASFGFSASMAHFGEDGVLSGSDYEFAAGQPFQGARFQDAFVPVLLADPGIQDLGAGNFQESLVLRGPAGTSQEAVWAFETLKGQSVSNTMLEGHWPTASDEIAMGRESLRLLGLQVGDRVDAIGGTVTESLRIVGVPVFPDFGFGPGLGRGVAMTMDGLRGFYPDVTQNLAVGNFAPGADHATVIARLKGEMPKDLGAAIGEAGALPGFGATVKETLHAGSLPAKLSLLFAFAAFATLVHLLVTSVRRRRRDLAILQTLGFRRGQIMATVAWQALILTGLALVVGIPIGILTGRLAWSAFAYRLGIVPDPVLSPLILIVIPVSLILALGVALGPGLAARRVRPAAILKAE